MLWRKRCLLLLIEESEKNAVFIEDFNALVYNHSLHLEENISVVIAYVILLQKKI